MEEQRTVEAKDNQTENHPQESMPEIDHISTTPQEDDEPRNDKQNALALVTVDPRASLSLVRDDNLEASRGASHKDSNPRNEVTDPQIVQVKEVDIQTSLSSACDENIEASRGASHEDSNLSDVLGDLPTLVQI